MNCSASARCSSNRATGKSKGGHLNLVVPIDLLPPILDDMMRTGRANKPARPWLGVFSTEVEDKVVIVGTAERSPAHRADLQAGDVVLAVADLDNDDLAGFYRMMWSLGKAGVEVPLTIFRDGDTFDVTINSTDRAKLLRCRECTERALSGSLQSIRTCSLSS